MVKGRWYWIRLEGDGEIEPAQYDGKNWLVNGLATELWPAKIYNWIKLPKIIRFKLKEKK